MKNRYSVLLVIDSKFEAKILNSYYNHVHFLPGSRLRNYLELLTGFGIPFKTVDITELRPHHLACKDEIQCSSILFTCPIKNIHSEDLTWLEKYSSCYGISLIADSFLFSGNSFFDPFGIEKLHPCKIKYGCLSRRSFIGQYRIQSNQDKKS